MNMDMTRRGFLKTGSGSALALLVGLNAKGVLAAGTKLSTDFNPFVTIDKDGIVTVMLKHFEMGQGTTTGLTTLVAEELDADWSTTRPEFAPADKEKYANLMFGAQGTGGSTAIANSFMQYRQAGATARALLVKAAAQKWNVPEAEISVSNGLIKANGKSSHFGEFIDIASKFPTPETVILKTPEQFNLIGKVDLPRKDSAAKTDGSAIFAMDIKLPGMVYAVILRSPKFGGTLVSFDKNTASEIAGFIDAKALPNMSGVVVYAKNTWAALQAREAIEASWDFSQAEMRSSEKMESDISAQLDKPEFNVHPTILPADVANKIQASGKKVEAEFSFPFLAHAPMEPLNCVIEPTDTGVRVHDGCQFPGMVHPTVANILGLTPEQVEVKTVYAGGSFGRRATPNADYQAEAAVAFDLFGRKLPMKMVWSREDDIKGGYYRTLAAHKATIGISEDNKITGWDHRIAAKSIMKGTFFEGVMVHEGVDETSVEGVKTTLYNLPNMSVGLSDFQSQVPVLWWRSVGHTHTAFAMESMMDIVASETGIDPIELRLSHLNQSNPQQKRMAGVIEAARDISKWNENKNGERKLGFASHFSFNTYVATVAEVTVSDRTVKIDKLHVAVDCGVAVNPDVIKAQMEGGSGYGLGAIIRNEITFTDGEIDQENFPDYEPLRMSEMPEINVHIIQSGEAPTGVGEPAVPPVGPAVANAIYQATGKRVTQLPMTKAGFDFA